MRVNVFGSETQRGWSMADSAKLLSISTPCKPTEPCPFGGRLPKKGRWTMWSFPASFPIDLPQRKCVKVSDGGETTIEKQPVDTETLFDGKIGYIHGMEIHCDPFREVQPQSKYYFVLKHTTRGVEVYVRERGVENQHYVFKYRSARLARVEMKGCRIPEYNHWTKRK